MKEIKYVDTDVLKEWVKSHPEFNRYEKNMPSLFGIYENHNPNYFCVIKSTPRDGPDIWGGQDVYIDAKERVLHFSMKIGLGFLRKTKYNWPQDSYYVGLNEEIIEDVLSKDLITEVTPDRGFYLKKPTKTRPGIEGSLFVPLKAIKTSVENEWYQIVKDNKIYVIPIFMTPRTLDAARKTDAEEGLVTHSVAQSVLNY